MRRQCGADFIAGAKQQRERAFRQTVLGDGLLDGAADQLGRAGVGVVRLDDHRATGGQCRRGVAARNREGEREVAGAEHHHGAQGNVGQAQVGARQRLALGLGRVDRGVQEVTVAHDAGEQTQLADRAAALALQTGDGQAGFLVRALDQRVANGHDVFSDAFQELGARFQRQGTVRVKGGASQFGGARHVVGGAGGVGRFQAFAGGGVDGVLGSARAQDGGRADQHLAGQVHGHLQR